jgi:hypothetical protein
MLKTKLLKKFKNKINAAIIIISLILVFFVVNNYPVQSQSITGINSDISQLRSRINRLESEVRNLRQANSSALPANNTPGRSTINEGDIPVEVDGELIGRSDPFSERLATLLIELREDVNDIESRLNALEAKQ